MDYVDHGSLEDINELILGQQLWLCSILEEITLIPHQVFFPPNEYRRTFRDYSIAERMSWMSQRITTRPEDVAYCLLGLLDVNMPLIYSEGARKAFFRLQEDIIKHTSDHTIFTWKPPVAAPDLSLKIGLFGDHPLRFSVSASRY